MHLSIIRKNQNSSFDGLRTSLIGTEDRPESADNGDVNTSHKSLDVTTLGTKNEAFGTDKAFNAPGRTRTCDLRFGKPLPRKLKS